MVRNSEQLIAHKENQERTKTEVNRLREKLKEKLQSEGLDIKTLFLKFDKNGDGVLSPFELECAFTVLEIPFAKDDLRKLIKLTDRNKDGTIDKDEFHAMLYSEPKPATTQNNDNLMDDVIEEASDYEDD